MEYDTPHTRSRSRAQTTVPAEPPPAEMRRIEESLRTVGACRVPASGVRMCTGTEPEAWEVFARHWDKLEADTYAAERGTRRFRRYGAFSFDAATARTSPLSHTSFVQPENSNPLYTEVERVFEPLTDAFADDPLLHGLLRLLGRAATGLDEARTWVVKVHPFRVVASADDAGEPTPEGMHRDGVTLVSSLLVNRSNARGGRSTVTTLDGRPLLETTLGKPGTLLLGDDRSTLHGVSRVRPRDLARSARRDVLVVTFAPESGQS